jgi:hypothetical protein
MMNRPTTTFNGQADAVTVVASHAAKLSERNVGSKHCHSNQRAAGLPLM